MEATQQLDTDVDNLSDENEDPNLTDNYVQVGCCTFEALGVKHLIY